VKKNLAFVLVGACATALLVYALNDLARAVTLSKSKSFMQEIFTLAQNVERYRVTHGIYPQTCDVAQLEQMLNVGYPPGALARRGIEYFSNGTDYTIILRADGVGSYESKGYGVFELRNGRWVAWPRGISQQYLDDTELRLRELAPGKATTFGEQPNHALNPTVLRVTALAENRKRRAARPAG